jgi:hypothetical protein
MYWPSGIIVEAGTNEELTARYNVAPSQEVESHRWTSPHLWRLWSQSPTSHKAPTHCSRYDRRARAGRDRVGVRTGGPKPDMTLAEGFKRSLLAGHTIVITNPDPGGAAGIHRRTALCRPHGGAIRA